MDLFGSTAVVGLVEREAGIRHDGRRKTQVAGRARRRLDGIVRAHAGDDHVTDAARVQPPFESRVEGIGHVLFDDVLVRQRHETLLEFRAALA